MDNLANSTLYRITTDLQKVKAALMVAEGQLPTNIQQNQFVQQTFANIQGHLTLVNSQVIALRHLTGDLQADAGKS